MPSTRSATRNKLEPKPSSPPAKVTGRRTTRVTKDAAAETKKKPEENVVPSSSTPFKTPLPPKRKGRAVVNKNKDKEVEVVTPKKIDDVEEKQNECVTPVVQTQKSGAAAASSSNSAESFPEGLDRKRQYYGIEVTSTPVKPLPPGEVTKKDIDTCFGFDADEEEENYTDLISPIQRPKTFRRPMNGFNELLARYNKEDNDNELEVHFDGTKVVKTYSHRRMDRHDIILPHVKHANQKKAAAEKKKHGKRHLDKDGMDPETKKWLEDKNKEFEDLLSVPLLVTKPTNVTKPTAGKSKK